MNKHYGWDTMQGTDDLSLSKAVRVGDMHQASEKEDSSSLIHQIGRSLIKNGELYRLRRQMGIVEHWVYFSSNVLEWHAFDPIRSRWLHLPKMSINECFLFADKESLAVGTEILVFGKEITSHIINQYSILTNTWTSGMDMNVPRCSFGSARLGENAIIAGGCDPRGNILSSAGLYNLDTGRWEMLPGMNKARKMSFGVFMDGKFYVIGGTGTGNIKYLTCGEVYDMGTRTWREIPNMFPAGNGRTGVNAAPPLLAVVNNELYAADHAVKEVMKYDKVRNSWSTLGSLPEHAMSLNGWGIAFRGCGERIVDIGGPRTMGVELLNSIPGFPVKGHHSGSC